MIVISMSLLVSLGSSDSVAADDSVNLHVAFSASMLPDGEEEAGDITNPFLKHVSEKMGTATITCVFPDHDLKTLGRKLVDGKEYQIAVVWGIECGWLQRMHPQLRILAVPIMGKKLSPSSLILIRNGPETKGFSLAGFSKNRPFRLSTYRRESLITRIHRYELEKKYGGAIRDAGKPKKYISDSLSDVLNGTSDGVLVDEYTLYKLDKAYADAMDSFRSHADWGNLSSPLIFAEPALICSKNRVDELIEGGFLRLQRSVLSTQFEKEGRELLKGWNAKGIVKPDQRFRDSIQRLSSQYGIDDF